MIIDKDIEVKVTGYNIRTFIDAFPNIEKGDTIEVNQIDGLSPRSTLEVECLCSNDGCEETYFRKRRNIHTETTYCSDECRGESIRRNNYLPRREKIREAVRQRINEGKSVRYWDIRREDSQLINSIDRHYPLYEVFKDLGITESEAVSEYGMTRNLNKRVLSKSEMLGRLKYLKSIGRLTTSAMRTEFEDNRLETSIKITYGSVERCFQELGISRDIYHTNTLIKMGNMFEQVFKEILTELNISFLYNKTLDNGYIPDFILEGKIIIDTKLSSWTNSIKSDIGKYSDYCDKLLFVYLREGSHLPRDKGKVQYVNVRRYVDELPENRQVYYNQKLNKILSYHPQP